jgi:polyhydroxyalkanoate synthesis regulator phasin
VGEAAFKCAIIDLANELMNKGTISKNEAEKLTANLLQKYHNEDYPERRTRTK